MSHSASNLTSASHLTSGRHGSRAVIDIGSNTVRLVVYGGCFRAPEILHNEKVTARLGKGVQETGRLSGKSQKTALAALARYRRLLDLSEVHEIDVVATAAVRDAANGAQFLDKVREIGFVPRLLSGEEEAVTSANGVAWAFRGAKGTVADLGGGSLELTEVDGMICNHGVSLPLGSLRLPGLRARGATKFRREVAAMLDSADWAVRRGDNLYLVGGSFRAFARYAIARNRCPFDDPHGFTLSAGEALKLARSVARTEPTDPVVAGLANARIEALPDTGALLAVLIEQLQPAQLVFSAWGLREGVLFSKTPPEFHEVDPLLSNIAEFGETMGVSAQTVAMVANWTLSAKPQEHDVPERLRLAAISLCLVLGRIEPALRQSFAREWALRKRWIGIAAFDRVMLATAMLASANIRQLDPRLARNASVEDLHSAQAWGLAVRLCRRFSALEPVTISGSKLDRQGSALTLLVSPHLATLAHEGTNRDLAALADHLGLQGAVKQIQESTGQTED